MQIDQQGTSDPSASEQRRFSQLLFNLFALRTCDEMIHIHIIHDNNIAHQSVYNVQMYNCQGRLNATAYPASDRGRSNKIRGSRMCKKLHIIMT